MVGVLYSMLWDISYIPLMQMEPFFQLAAPGGAEATDSLLLDYASVSLPAVLFKSIKKAHGTIFGLLLLCFLFHSVYRLLLRLYTLARPGLALALETEAIANPHLR